MSNLTTSFFGIEKADKNSDGTLTVYGKATDDALDIDKQICDGIENCVQYIHNFNPEKSSNPFAYFTQIIHYAFCLYNFIYSSTT